MISKTKIIIFTTLMLILCVSFGCTQNKNDIKIKDGCKSVPGYWYGEKGESPANNDVWKCYNWELIAR